ncbi:TPA: WYL domain-containing protein [Vibrio parahaemolyticus]|nr:WYL domain-containing protein [Vibrio parahaemolyticus]HBC3383584.1 WYL domain-containing protein [Vibrio parahaemolyticus]HBC3445574.1 WYL domain-containing protein [Vibrio parahaemolyticus]HBC3845392.1 WYL domain-containing protein [Vibrio parahaemolyticus]HBH7861971.1 WYL domain-containing protein [Vibrio parahaemolyticus]
MSDLVQERRRKSAILRNLVMVDNIPIYPKRGIATADIHQALLDEGYDISKRTVQRDLEKLSEWAALDYEDDEQGHRRWFRDIKKPDVMDVVPASEAFLLVLSEKLLRKAVPVNLSEKMEEWFKKADAKLSSKHLLSSWKSKVNVVSDSYPLIYDEHHIDEEHRKVLYDCVLNEEQVQISYQSNKSDQAKDYMLNPLGLIIRDQSHYLVATRDVTPEKPQLFLFHRISSAKKLYLDITKPKTFSIEEYFAKNPSGWLLEDRVETIELKVKGYALDVVTHNKLAEDQILEPCDETWWKVTFSCHPTYDLISWIFKFGQDVVCEAPVTIRKQVVNRLNATLNNY